MRVFIRLFHYVQFLWDLIVANFRLLRGMWKLTKLQQPAITVFGGARVKEKSKYDKMAVELGQKLAQEGFSVITGGGPGIMQAANQGAFNHVKNCNLEDKKCTRVLSLGIGLTKLNTEAKNDFLHEHIEMNYFFSRKWLLVRHAAGFVVFPGGFGTLDELFEIITLKQTERMQDAPVVLVDSDYWEPIIYWAKEKALKEQLVSEKDISFLNLVDSLEDGIAILKKHCFGC